MIGSEKWEENVQMRRIKEVEKGRKDGTREKENRRKIISKDFVNK